MEIQTEEIREAEIQEAIDLVSFGRLATVRCWNCDCPRTVGHDDSFPYMVEKCPQCGDDETDLLEDVTI